MKIYVGIFLFYCINLTSSFLSSETCEDIKCFKTCKIKNSLVSVTVTNRRHLNCPDTLFIKDREITSIKSSAFKNLPISTLTIDVSKENLNIEPDSFNGLRLLKTLEIFSGIVTLKNNLFQSVKTVTSLSLTIDGTKQNFKGAFKELPFLKKLSISSSDLKKIDSETFLNFHPAIIELKLSQNNINSIEPGSFSSFKNLNKLQINSNGLTKLESESFCNLKNLKRLRIADENIESFSQNVFKGLEKLETLELMNNKKFKNLELLDIVGLGKLSDLDLRLNSIENISKNIFNGNKKLKKINLKNNRISRIDRQAFFGLNLTRLDLANNDLKNIANGAFENLRVRELDLSNNNIIEIQQNAFLNNWVVELYLYDNSVSVNKTAWGLSELTQVFSDEL